MGSPNWELVDASQVPERLMQDIHRADERIALQAMHMVIDGITRPVVSAAMHEIMHKPRVAEHAIVLPDAFSKWHFDTEEQADNLGELVKVIQVLGDIGVKARFGQDFPDTPLGYVRRKLTSKMGRDHRKIYLADNVSYSFGGCNFSDESFMHNHDFLLRTEDEAVSEYLYEKVSEEFSSDKAQSDDHKMFGDRDMVVVDGGKRSRSSIQLLAEAIVRGAEPDTIRFVSQLRPSDRIEAALYTGDPAMSVFNRSENIRGIMRFQQRVEETKPPLPRIAYPERYVHAKFITACLVPDRDRPLMPEGGPVVLTGSHNYHMWGVWAGTKEIALLSSQESLVAAINDWADESFDTQA